MVGAPHDFKVAELRLTFREWNDIMPSGIKVMDPDGFRRDKKGQLYTRQEWLDRAMNSTIIPQGGWSAITSNRRP